MGKSSTYNYSSFNPHLDQTTPFTLRNLRNGLRSLWSSVNSALTDLRDVSKAAYELRSEVYTGGITSSGATLSISAPKVDMTAMQCTLLGLIQAPITALADQSLIATADSVAQPIFTDGATAAAITLASQVSKTIYATIIVANTNGAGGATTADNAAPKLILVVKGTAGTYLAQTTAPTTTEIEAALAASTGVHAGVTGWAHVGEVRWAVAANGSTISMTHRPNRNNRVYDV